MKARALLFGVFVLAGCAQKGSIEIVLDKPDTELLLNFYFGSYVNSPFESGLLTKSGERFFVDPLILDELRPGMGRQLSLRAPHGVLTWDSLGSFLSHSYYEARELPHTIEEFEQRWPYSTWLEFQVKGPMTRARRHIYIQEASLIDALKTYRHNDQKLLYEPGTAVVADHYLDNEIVEHTAMVRREDDFWDYVTYGTDGSLSVSTQALPRALQTPLECVGCHFGSRLFEPERSYPEPAGRAPDGERAYYVPDEWRDKEVAMFFEEHMRRSDAVLGLYATLYVSRIRSERDTISVEQQMILDELGL